MHITEFENMYYIDQDFYINKNEQIPYNDEFSLFVSMRIKLTRLANTTADVVFEISQIAQVTRAMYEKDINKYYKRLKRNQICA